MSRNAMCLVIAPREKGTHFTREKFVRRNFATLPSPEGYSKGTGRGLRSDETGSENWCLVRSFCFVSISTPRRVTFCTACVGSNEHRQPDGGPGQGRSDCTRNLSLKCPGP